jgi:uncharacterized iron-regulated membrane protein
MHNRSGFMFRNIVFWSHLILGVGGGILIGIMSFTGAALAFEKELIAWAERDARRIDAIPTGGARLLIDQLLERARAAKPDLRISAVNVSSDSHAAIAFALPNNAMVYANPFTGEVREPHAPRMRAFMQTMRGWHTRLNFKPTPGRPTLGAKLNAAANAGFVLLCLSGLILWWPRAWTARVVRPSLWFVRGARGKARDWNWHNVIGVWTVPVLFIMAATGVVLSYRWAGDLVFRLVGETPPAPIARPATPPSPAPALSASSLSLASSGSVVRPNATSVDAELHRIQAQFPAWELITLRFNPPVRGDAMPTPPVSSAIVRSADQWPPFATTAVTLNPQTGELGKTDTFASLSRGQRIRRWIRLLHTGEALRWPGELVAGVGCVGACVLVWTGLALAWRRFFGRVQNESTAS